MPRSHSLIIELNNDVSLPLFPPGATIALTPEPGFTAAPTRRAQNHRVPGGTGRIGPAPAHGRRLGCIRAGTRRYGLHIVPLRHGRRRSTAAVTTCCLTAFVQPAPHVRKLVRRTTARRIDAYLEQLRRCAPDADVGRQLQFCVLLQLQVSRSLTAADRRHPALQNAWQAWLRSERRRMLRRLRHAVRRLECRRRSPRNRCMRAKTATRFRPAPD